MFDPFLAADPPVLVHEINSPDFEHAWSAPDSDDIHASGRASVPLAAQRERGTGVPRDPVPAREGSPLQSVQFPRAARSRD